jgi:hypothetical protein
VKVRTRKILHSSTEKKEARAKAAQKIAAKLERLNNGVLADDVSESVEEEEEAEEEEEVEEVQESPSSSGPRKPPPRRKKGAAEDEGDRASSPTGVDARVSGGVDEETPEEPVEEPAPPPEPEPEPAPVIILPLSEAGQARLEAARKKRLEAEAAKPKVRPYQQHNHVDAKARYPKHDIPISNY